MAKKEKLPKVGETVSSRGLRSLYGVFYLDSARSEYFKELPRERGDHRNFEVIKVPPSAQEFKALLDEKYRTDISSVIEDAFTEAEDLAQELHDWQDSIPENLQGGDKYSELDEAISTLEGISRPDIDDEIEALGLTVIIYPDYESKGSRSSRACFAASSLRQVSEALSEAEETHSELADELRNLSSEIDSAADELDGVSFPSMM